MSTTSDRDPTTLRLLDKLVRYEEALLAIAANSQSLENARLIARVAMAEPKSQKARWESRQRMSTPIVRLEQFTIRRTDDNKVAFLFSPDSDFPAFETETALDMKLVLVRLLKECDALERLEERR